MIFIAHLFSGRYLKNCFEPPNILNKSNVIDEYYKKYYLKPNSVDINDLLNSTHYQQLLDLGLGLLWGSMKSVQFYIVPQDELKFIQYSLKVKNSSQRIEHEREYNIEDFHLSFLNYVTGISVFSNDLDIAILVDELKNDYLLSSNTSASNFEKYQGNYLCFGITTNEYYRELNALNIGTIVDLPNHDSPKKIFIDTNIPLSLLKHQIQNTILASNGQGLLTNQRDPRDDQYARSDEDMFDFLNSLNTGTNEVIFLFTNIIFEEFLNTSIRKLKKIIRDNNRFSNLRLVDENLINLFIQKLEFCKISFAHLINPTEKYIYWKIF